MVNFNDRAERARYLAELQLDAAAEVADREARKAAAVDAVCDVSGWPVGYQPEARSRAQRAANEAALRRLVEQVVEQKFAAKIALLLDAFGEVVSEERRRHKNEIRKLRASLKALREQVNASQKYRLVA